MNRKTKNNKGQKNDTKCQNNPPKGLIEEGNDQKCQKMPKKTHFK